MLTRGYCSGKLPNEKRCLQISLWFCKGCNRLNNYDELVDNSTPSCLTYYIPCKTKDFSAGVFSIMQIPLTITSTRPVVSPSLFSFFFFGNMLRFNRYS